MSPTVLRILGFRFYFFSREESRMHVHVEHETGEAKFWMEPQIELANNHGLNAENLNAALKLTMEHQNEIRVAWDRHFKR